MQFIRPNVGQCTAVTLPKLWSSVTNSWLMEGGWLEGSSLVSSMSITGFLQGTMFHPCSPTFPQSCCSASAHSNMPCLSLPFSTLFFKQSKSMYKSERFLHGVPLDRKMGIQKGHGTNLLTILLLAVFRNTEKLKIPCSYHDQGRRHSYQKYRVQRQTQINSSGFVYIHSSFCSSLFADPFH